VGQAVCPAVEVGTQPAAAWIHNASAERIAALPSQWPMVPPYSTPGGGPVVCASLHQPSTK
jgi:hypothetical protein